MAHKQESTITCKCEECVKAVVEHCKELKNTEVEVKGTQVKITSTRADFTSSVLTKCLHLAEGKHLVKPEVDEDVEDVEVDEGDGEDVEGGEGDGDGDEVVEDVA
jgi:hypothetical protein